jgi:hypothetical protein
MLTVSIMTLYNNNGTTMLSITSAIMLIVLMKSALILREELLECK